MPATARTECGWRQGPQTQLESLIQVTSTQVLESSPVCLPGCALAESWNWKWSQDWNLVWEAGVPSGRLTSASNTYPITYSMMVHGHCYTLNGPRAFQAVAIGAIPFPPNHCFPESPPSRSQSSYFAPSQKFPIKGILGIDFYKGNTLFL